MNYLRLLFESGEKSYNNKDCCSICAWPFTASSFKHFNFHLINNGTMCEGDREQSLTFSISLLLLLVIYFFQHSSCEMHFHILQYITNTHTVGVWRERGGYLGGKLLIYWGLKWTANVIVCALCLVYFILCSDSLCFNQPTYRFYYPFNTASGKKMPKRLLCHVISLFFFYEQIYIGFSFLMKITRTLTVI